jgi:protein-L-isoaspartate(D-aspartate) O-methyltransferase
MVERQLSARGICDEPVLRAMATVPREQFAPESYQHIAYADTPIPIRAGQTISQPYIVAYMLQALELCPTDRVLEIGTGSGYAAAVLSHLVASVYTVECIDVLYQAAVERLAALGYANVHVKLSDGTLGWPEHAPYDAIVVAAGGPKVPQPLRQQLAVGGRLIMPVGTTRTEQRLVRVTRHGQRRFVADELVKVAFVPLIGEEGW